MQPSLLPAEVLLQRRSCQGENRSSRGKPSSLCGRNSVVLLFMKDQRDGANMTDAEQTQNPKGGQALQRVLLGKE